MIVDTRAVGLNPLDIRQRSGTFRFFHPTQFPVVLGNEFAGVVSAVGARVEALAVGDAVFARTNKVRLGALAEQVAIEADLAGKNIFWPRRDFLFTAIFRRRENSAAITTRLGDRVRALGLDPEHLLADSHDDDYILWAFIMHRGSLPASFTSKAQDDPAALRELLAERTAGWHPDLRRLLSASTPDTLYQTGFSAAEPLAQGETGNVTGLGDAVHHTTTEAAPPRNNQAQNKAFNDTIRDAEGQIGRSLTKAERRRVHDAISKKGYGYHNIVDEVIGMFGGGNC